MKAYEKFEARLQELGLYDEWLAQGKTGRIGIEKSSGIIVLVHEDRHDKYTEFVYPPMSELEKDKEFRERALENYLGVDDDYKFTGQLYMWANYPENHDCPLEPVDVYFLTDTTLTADFEDDTEVTGEIGTWDFDSDTTEEYCPHCDTAVDLEHDFKVQKCPNCGKWIVPCTICPLQNCSKHCPLERHAVILNGESKE